MNRKLLIAAMAATLSIGPAAARGDDPGQNFLSDDDIRRIIHADAENDARRERLKKIEKEAELARQRKADENARLRVTECLTPEPAGDPRGKGNLAYFVMGCTQAYALRFMGSPDRVNRTVVRGATHEQWVYPQWDRSALYLYLDNGRVTSYQD